MPNLIEHLIKDFDHPSFYNYIYEGRIRRQWITELINMDRQSQEFLNAVKKTADAPRKAAKHGNARFLNPATVQQLNEYLATL